MSTKSDFSSAFLWLIMFTSVSGQKLNYTLEMPDPHTHYFEVTVSLDDLTGEYLDLKMPTWAPGSYLIREFSKNVEGFRATGKRGNLNQRKVDKNTWRVFLKDSKDVEVSYRVYAFEMSVRTSFLDRDHGYVNGSSVFMYPDNQLGLKSTLTINPYPGWSTVTTALKPLKESKFEFQCPDYHTLADSPIEIGNHEVHNFEAAGVEHIVAIYGQGNYRLDTLLKDMAIVVEEVTEVFGQNPNTEFTFLIHNLDKGSGGLEHSNSTTLQVDRWTYQPYERYLRFLTLVAHEYFHLWNVKRLKPKSFIPYDYDQENYTRLLWVMEGLTDYYDLLLIRSAGLMTDDLFLRKLVGTINFVENSPGNTLQPVADASFDAWIKAYRPNENSGNSSISYYSKGALVGLILDLAILRNSQGKYSLDHLFRYLYEQHFEKQNEGLTEGNLAKAMQKFLGEDPQHFLDDFVYGTNRLEYERHLNYVGLDLVNQSDSLSVELGVSFEPGNDLRVSRVVRGTMAYDGGINVGDEIIALDKYRVFKSNLRVILDNKIVGDSIRVDLAREGRIRTLHLEILPSRSFDYAIVQVAEPGDEQIALFQRWLRLD